MIAAPFVMLLHDLQTLFAITNRRALITDGLGQTHRDGDALLYLWMRHSRLSDIGSAETVNFASGPRPALPTRITPAATGSAASKPFGRSRHSGARASSKM